MPLLTSLGSRVIAALFFATLFVVGDTSPAAAQSLSAGTSCASEDGYCRFSGSQFVRYGAGDRFVVRLLTDGTACTNAVFGDPAPNVRKSCTIETAIFPTQRCADEEGQCRFGGTRFVFYGAGERFAALPMTNGALCSNLVFGDPAPGVRKACYTGAVSPARRVVLCAEEDGRCSFTGSRLVYYGAGDRFAVRLLTNGTACTNTVFGDPVPNVRKVCYVAR
jgi:hypothetical protein